MLPEVSLKILKALQMESLKSKKIILEWSFVLETVKKKVKETQVLDGYDLYLMLCLLKNYSLVSSNILLCTSKILYHIFLKNILSSLIPACLPVSLEMFNFEL